MVKIILFIIIIFFSMFVQSLTGFGGPLLAMPLSIVLLGVELSRPVIMIAAIVAAFLVAAPRYRDINWKKLAFMVIIMMIGVIAGDFLIASFPNAKPLLVIYGIIVGFIGCKRLFVKDSRALPVPVQYGAVVAAGLMQGLFVSGGSFLVLYAVEQMKEKREFRATMSAVWVPLNLYMLIKNSFTGVINAEVLHLSAIIIIPELLAIFLAAKLTERLKQETFLKITYIILAVSGVILIINSVM